MSVSAARIRGLSLPAPKVFNMSRSTAAALVASVAFGLSIVGCGGGPTSEPIANPAPPPALKQVLLSIADSGEVGSAGMEARNQIEELRKTDVAKADEMAKGLAELETMQSPAQVKTKATELANKL